MGLMTKISLGLSIIIMLMIGAFYIYYSSSQARIETLILDKARLELAVRMQDETITRQREFIAFQQQYSSELQRGLADVERERENTLSNIRVDLEGLDDIDLDEVERRINATYERLRSQLQQETENWSIR